MISVTKVFFRMLTYFTVFLLVFILPFFLIEKSYANAVDSVPHEAYWLNGEWIHENSTLVPDSSLHFGKLSNGFRYVFLPYPKQDENISIYLNVQAGSMMENSNQLGYAHFVEHMAFNGTKNFPAGSLQQRLHRHNIALYANVNAQTYLTETVYKINLNSYNSKQVSLALELLKDFSDGMLIEPVEVEQEKKVILAEKKVRDKEIMVNRSKRLANLYPNMPFSRPSIGTENSILTATSNGLKDFYTTWYTPDRMILVVAGNFDRIKMEEEIEKIFSSIKQASWLESPSSSIPFIPNWGKPENLAFRIFAESRPITTAEVTLILHFPRMHIEDSEKKRKNILLDTIIEYSLQNRLEEKANMQNISWTFAYVMNNWRSGILPNITLNANVENAQWDNVLRLYVQELKSIQKYGISQEELDKALEYLAKNLHQKDIASKNFSSQRIADNFIYSENSDRVMISQEKEKEILESFSKEISLEKVNALAKQIFIAKDISLIVGGQNPPSVEEIKAIWHEEQNKKTIQYQARKAINFPYLELPKQELLASSSSLKSEEIKLDKENTTTLYSYVLDNKIPLYFLPLPYEENKVKVQLLFGNGYQGLSDEQINVAQATSLALQYSGIGSLSFLDSKNILQNLGIIKQENHKLSNSEILVSGDSSQLEKLIQIAWTQYTDPKLSSNSLDKVKLNLENYDHFINDTTYGANLHKGTSFFFGNARQYRNIELVDFNATQKDLLDVYLLNSRKNPLTILISGDFNLDKAFDYTQRYFSQIASQKHNKRPIKEFLFPKNGLLEIESKEELDQAIYRQEWLLYIKSKKNVEFIIENQLLAILLKNKLRDDIREKIGATYSPSVQFLALPNEENAVLMQVQIHTDRMQLEKISKYMEELAKWNVTEKEFELAKTLYMKSNTMQKLSNRYWEDAILKEIIFAKNYKESISISSESIQKMPYKDIKIALENLFTQPSAIFKIKSEEIE